VLLLPTSCPHEGVPGVLVEAKIAAVPAIVSNMKVNIGLCLVGVIIGEFLAARNGLGYLIIYSSQVFKLDWLLMSICILCILAMGLYALINLLEKLYQKYF
jgi:NitT/TauT family transport system permease protein